jgi:hypothetical protein
VFDDLDRSWLAHAGIRPEVVHEPSGEEQRITRRKLNERSAERRVLSGAKQPDVRERDKIV